MSSFDIISINNTNIVITNRSTGNPIQGVITPAQLNVSYAIGSIPTCTVVLTDGHPFDGFDIGYSLISQVLTEFRTGNLDISVSFNVSFISPGQGVISKKDISIFKGVVTAVNLNDSASAYGNSAHSVVITAYHRFSELYQYGANGMIYCTPSSINTYGSLTDLIKSMQATNKSNLTSTDVFNASIVQAVLDRHTVTGDGSSRKDPRSAIVTVIDDITKTMIENKIIEPSDNLKITDYIEGSTYPIMSSKFVRTFTKGYLENFWSSVSSGSIGSSILTIATSRYNMLTVAPRSSDKLTIIPLDGITVYDPIPMVSKDMYHSIDYNIPKGIHPEADGVLIAKSGSDYYAPNSGDNGVIIGKYPNIKSDTKIRWKYVMAPSWLADREAYESTAPKGSKPGTTDKSFKDTCNVYAEYLYKGIIHEDNRAILSMDARCIEAFKALGSVIGVETMQFNTIQGLFTAYDLSYTQSAKSSSLSINVHLSHVMEYSKDSNNITNSKLFEIEDSDKIHEFPDISKGTI